MSKNLLTAVTIMIIATFATDTTAQNTRTRQKRDSIQQGNTNRRPASSDSMSLRHSIRPHTHDNDSMHPYRNDSIPGKRNMPGQ